MSEKENTASSGPTKTETLMGGVEVIVSTTAGTETVHVRQLKIKEYRAYQVALEDEIALVALLTGKTQEWAETLSQESHEAIVLEGDRVNGDFFSRWAQRQTKFRDRLIPGYAAKILGMFERKPEPESTSQTSSQK